MNSNMNQQFNYNTNPQPGNNQQFNNKKKPNKVILFAGIGARGI